MFGGNLMPWGNVMKWRYCSSFHDKRFHVNCCHGNGSRGNGVINAFIATVVLATSSIANFVRISNYIVIIVMATGTRSILP